MESRNGVVPSAWLTHPVYSSQTWIGNRDLRLERTLMPRKISGSGCSKRLNSVRRIAPAVKNILPQPLRWDTSAPHNLFHLHM